MNLVRMALIAGITLSASLLAQPDVTSFAPSGLTRGTEAEVRFSGRRLTAIKAILTQEPGIEVQGITATSDRNARLRIAVSEDARVGAHHLHLRGTNGLSRRLRFFVGTFPQLSDRKASEAERLTLPLTIDGQLTRGEADRFIIELPRGPITLQAEGLRLGSGVDTDPIVEVQDLAGHTVARADDDLAGRMDPWLEFTIEKAGPYVVTIRDAQWNGSSRHRYRMHIAATRRALCRLPLGAKAAQDLQDARWLFARATETGPCAYRPLSGGRLASPWRIDGSDQLWPTPLRGVASPLPIRGETGSKDANPPAIAAEGVIAKARERDRWTIEAKSGQRLRLKVRARELDSPLDPVLSLRDDKGAQVAANDDTRGHPDSALNYRVRRAGKYSAHVYDRLGRGGPGFFYRLEIETRAVPPSLRMDLPRRDSPIQIAIPRGGRAAVSLSLTDIDRRPGGQLKAIGLPAGVRCLEAKIHPSDRRVALVLEATEDAALAAGHLEFNAEQPKRKEALAIAFVQDEALVTVENNRVLNTAQVDRLPVVITRPAPFSIEVDAPTVPIVAESGLNIPVRIKRRKGFDETISLRLLHRPPGISASRPRVAGKDSAGVISVNHRRTIPSGAWTLVVIASSRDRGNLIEVASKPFALEVARPFFRVRAGRVRGQRGEKLELDLRLDRSQKFDGKARLEIPNLPRGITATLPEIASGDQRLKLPLQLTKSAAGGRHRRLIFRLHIPVAGGTAVQDVRGGEIRVDTKAPPAATPKGETKKKLGTVENPKT